MAINNITPIGDDQLWKQQVENLVTDLIKRVAVLEAQVNSRSN
jgi:hypothetical protein